MTKAWDFKDLTDRLKAKGLPMAEAAAKLATGEVLDWVSASLALETSMIAKIAAPAVAIVKPMILDLEDGIDGIKGN